jgi:hypothetical protein
MPLMFLCPAVVAPAQVSIGINFPGVSIGINQPVYPELVPVPGYPVYYAPGSAMNMFFYDGLYWVYQNNQWYSSEWYNGPWGGVNPNDVPLYVLRVPVSYYRQPPPYFAGWDRNAPPRWGEHWGHAWEQRRGGWDHWDHHAGPALAPLPTYQRQFSGDRYPRPDQQAALHSQNYHYQPREAVVQARYQQQRAQAPAAPLGQGRPGVSPRQQGPGPVPAPHPQPSQHPQQAPRPGGSNPPAAQRPKPAPPAQQNHEAAHGNAGRQGKPEDKEKPHQP